jgi:nucleotide-binding universal stress UspA family protein
VDSIIEAAGDWQPDLIGMPTAGHHGFLDALRGSTTERVLRRAPCPLLVVPVANTVKASAAGVFAED